MWIMNSNSSIFRMMDNEKGDRFPSGNLPPCGESCAAQRAMRVLSELMDYFITLKVWLLPPRVVTLTRIDW